MTQIRHDNPANALRMVASTCSCQVAVEPRYRSMVRKEAMNENADAGAILSRCSRISSLRPWNVVVASSAHGRPRAPGRWGLCPVWAWRDVLFFLFAHALGQLHAAQATKETDRVKRTRFRKFVPDHVAFQFRAGTWTRDGAVCESLADVAAESGCIPEGAFVLWAFIVALVGDDAEANHGYVPLQWTGHLV